MDLSSAGLRIVFIICLIGLISMVQGQGQGAGKAAGGVPNTRPGQGVPAGDEDDTGTPPGRPPGWTPPGQGNRGNNRPSLPRRFDNITFCIPRPDLCNLSELFPDPLNCRSFSRCKQNQWQNQTCTRREKFDVRTMSCTQNPTAICYSCRDEVPTPTPPRQSETTTDIPDPDIGNGSTTVTTQISQTGPFANPDDPVCNLSSHNCSSQTLMPDPSNCNFYQECVFNRWIKRPCSPGTRFDSLTLKCNHTHEATCQLPCPGKSPTAPPITSASPLPNTRIECNLPLPCLNQKVIGDPNDCSAFYLCFGGAFWARGQCPETQPFFDWRINQCMRANKSYECTHPCESVTPVSSSTHVKASPTFSIPYVTETTTPEIPEPAYPVCVDITKNMTIDSLCNSPTRRNHSTCNAETALQTHLHPTDCRRHFMCLGYIWMQGSCASGTFYDVKTCSCVNDTQGECITLKCDGKDKLPLFPDTTRPSTTTSAVTPSTTTRSTPSTIYTNTPTRKSVSKTTKTRSTWRPSTPTTVPSTPAKQDENTRTTTRITTGIPTSIFKNSTPMTKSGPPSTTTSSPRKGTTSVENISDASTSGGEIFSSTSQSQKPTNLTSVTLITTETTLRSEDGMNASTTTTTNNEETLSPTTQVVTSPMPTETVTPTKISTSPSVITQSTTGKQIMLTDPSSTTVAYLPTTTLSSSPTSVEPTTTQDSASTPESESTPLSLSSTSTPESESTPLSLSSTSTPESESTPLSLSSTSTPESDSTPLSLSSTSTPESDSTPLSLSSTSISDTSTSVTLTLTEIPTTMFTVTDEPIYVSTTDAGPDSTPLSSPDSQTPHSPTPNISSTSESRPTMSSTLSSSTFSTSSLPKTTVQENASTISSFSTLINKDKSTNMPMVSYSPSITNISEASASVTTTDATTEETSFPDVDNAVTVTPTPMAGITNATTGSTDLSTTENAATTTATVVPSSTVDTKIMYCQDDTFDGKFWKRTPVGTEIEQRCAPLSGSYVRKCVEGTRGKPAWRPPVNLCVSEDFQKILESAQNIEVKKEPGKVDVPSFAVEDAVNELTNKVRRDVETDNGLSGGDLNATLEALDILTSLPHDQDFNFSDAQTTRLVNTAGNVLSKKNTPGWEAIRERHPGRASVLMKSVDRIAEQASRKVPPGSQMQYSVSNLEIQLESRYKGTKADVEFTPRTPPGVPSGMIPDKVLVDAKTIESLSEDIPGEKIAIWSTLYYTINDFLPSGRDDFFNSRVQSCSIKGLPRGKNLKPPVHLHFSALNSTVEAGPECKYWEYNSLGGGFWSEKGCQVLYHNSSGTVCACDHLTNFAVLISPYALDGMHETILSLISVIGCLLSILGMFVTISLYILSWKRVKSHHAAVLINLCIALIIANTIFLAGVNRTETRVICMAIAGLLHFFYLAAFFMMFADGVQFILYVVQVFHVRRKKETFLLILTCWFLPAVIVAITLSITRGEGYGTDKYCWLRKDNGLIAAFAGPALLVVLVNFCILCVILRTIAKSKGSEKKNRLKATIWNIAVMMPLLGLTWVFGIFSVNDKLIYFQYIFAVCNSLQGFFIFFFHCALNKKMRQAVVERFSSRSSQSSSLRKSAGSNKSDKKNAARKQAKKNNKRPTISPPKPMGRPQEYINPQMTTPLPDEVEAIPEQQYMELDDPAIRHPEAIVPDMTPPSPIQEMNQKMDYPIAPMATQTPGQERQHRSFMEGAITDTSGEPYYENHTEYEHVQQGNDHDRYQRSETPPLPPYPEGPFDEPLNLPPPEYESPQMMPDERLVRMPDERLVRSLERPRMGYEMEDFHHHSLDRPSHKVNEPIQSLQRLPYYQQNHSLERQRFRDDRPSNSLERTYHSGERPNHHLGRVYQTGMGPSNSLERLHHPNVSLDWIPHHIPRPHIQINRAKRGLPRTSLSMDDLTSIGQDHSMDPHTNPWMPVQEDPYLSPVSPAHTAPQMRDTFDPRHDSRRSPYMSDNRRRLGQNSLSMENLDQHYLPRRYNESSGGISTNSLYRFASREKGSAYIILEPELEYAMDRNGLYGHVNEEEPVYMQIEGDVPPVNSQSSAFDYRTARA